MAVELDPRGRRSPSVLLPPASACPRDRRPSLPACPLRISRVSQLDADLLDDELFGLFKDELWDGLRLFKPRFRDLLEPELIALLRFVAHSLLVQTEASASYGCQLQNLTYRNERGVQSNANHNLAPTTIQKRLHALLHVGSPWAWQRIMRASAAHGWAEQFEDDIRWKIWSALRKVENVYRAMSLANFLHFLYDGKYPTLIDRLLGMRLVYAGRETGRRVSFEFLNRQLVWHAFTEFLTYLIPLINIRRVRRVISRLLLLRASGRRRADSLAKLPARVCAICYERADDEADAGGMPSTSARLVDVHTPSRALPCGHVYCYFCLASESMAEPKWECLRCGEVVKGMKRVSPGELESEEEEERETGWRRAAEPTYREE